MKRLLFVCAMLVVGSFFVVAEDAPKFDFYGGWNYLHLSSDYLYDGINSYKGFGVSGCAYLTPNFGIVGDFSWNNKKWDDMDIVGVDEDSASAYFIMGGPQFVMRSHDAVAPFVRGLFGIAHLKGAYRMNDHWYSESANKFCFGFGGGVDVKVSDNVSIRLAQFDYIRITGEWTKSNVFRFGAGIVFNAR